MALFVLGERGGSVVECRTPEQEVGGSKPTAAVLCPWARHFTPRKYWLITQKAVAPSRHDWKIVDLDIKLQHKQTKLFVLLKLILQTRMRSHPVGLYVWFLVGPFVYFHISCVRTAKALARLRGCTGSPGAFTGRLCDKYYNLLSWLILLCYNSLESYLEVLIVICTCSSCYCFMFLSKSIQFALLMLAN